MISVLLLLISGQGCNPTHKRTKFKFSKSILFAYFARGSSFQPHPSFILNFNFAVPESKAYDLRQLVPSLFFFVQFQIWTRQFHHLKCEVCNFCAKLNRSTLPSKPQIILNDSWEKTLQLSSLFFGGSGLKTKSNLHISITTKQFYEKHCYRHNVPDSRVIYQIEWTLTSTKICMSTSR